jgi:hypothetical protein
MLSSNQLSQTLYIWLRTGFWKEYLNQYKEADKIKEDKRDGTLKCVETRNAYEILVGNPEGKLL